MFALAAIVIVLAVYVYFSNNLTSTRDESRWEVVDITSIAKEELELYPHTCLISQRGSRSTLSRSNRRTTETLKMYSVYLVSASYRKKIKVFSSHSLSRAKSELVRISEKYDKPIVRYAPRISEKTKNRRRW